MIKREYTVPELELIELDEITTDIVSGSNMDDFDDPNHDDNWETDPEIIHGN